MSKYKVGTINYNELMKDAEDRLKHCETNGTEGVILLVPMAIEMHNGRIGTVHTVDPSLLRKKSK